VGPHEDYWSNMIVRIYSLDILGLDLKTQKILKDELDSTIFWVGELKQMRNWRWMLIKASYLLSEQIVEYQMRLE
jgi:hypothetical protein